MTEWHENEKLWIELAPVIFTPERRAQAAGEVDKLCRLIDVPAGATVLDVGCGVGRHTLALAKRGHPATGIDAIAPYIEEAKRIAAERELDVEFIRADMRQFRRSESFDLAVNLLTSFGYFADPADDRRVVDNMFASLRPGGKIVIDLMPREVLARMFRERDWSQHPDGMILLEERRVSDNWTMLHVKWIVLRDEQRFAHEFTLRLYTADQLEAVLAAAGFADIRAYGSLGAAPYDHAAERLVIVARKP
jgi:SAM-dependent methyltransferase